MANLSVIQEPPALSSSPSSAFSTEDYPPDDHSTSSPESPHAEATDSIENQISTIKSIQNGDFSDENAILGLPQRRRKSQRSQAVELAKTIYPQLSEMQAIILYESVILGARSTVRRIQADRITEGLKPKTNAGGRLMRLQGPWAGQEIDPVDLKGPSAIPMPVTIGGAEEFKPIFEFLSQDIAYEDAVKAQKSKFYALPTDESVKGKFGHELNWNTPLLEFNRGILYEDGRLDLCKKVVGPTHIRALMRSLELNTQIRQFLLGNNAISTTGAKAIAEFVQKYPNRIETWYLAGGHLTRHGLSLLVPQMIKSTSITNLWFKRNPFGPNSSNLLAELVLRAPNLRTLDLETTELGDGGTRRFIDSITSHRSALKHLYLNANGIGKGACASLATYLVDSHCTLDSLFLSTNPIGDAGMILLAPGLAKNKTLKRLTLQSTGLTSKGVIDLANAISSSELKLHTLDLGASMTTTPHRQKFNYIDDACVEALKLIILSPHMRSLNIGRTAFSFTGLDEIRSAASHSELVFLNVHRVELADRDPSIDSPTSFYTTKPIVGSCSLEMRNRLAANQKKYYPNVESYDKFLASEELRFLKNTGDVRKIDSQYRTQDKRLGLPMDTKWEEGDET